MSPLRGHSEFERAYGLSQCFQTMVRKREGQLLKDWLAACKTSNVAELVSFGAGLEQEEQSVRLALELPYSNGVTEGQVNRLKMLKRTMYGRAGFELLRMRVLAA